MSKTLNRWYLMAYARMVMVSFLSVAVVSTRSGTEWSALSFHEDLLLL
jgi:hypothetical protein